MIDVQTLQMPGPMQRRLAEARKRRMQRLKTPRRVNNQPSPWLSFVEKYKLVFERWPETIRKPSGMPQKIHRIIIEVSRQHGVSVLDMLSPRRRVDIVAARYEAVWRCRNETIFSLPQIGRYFNRDHTSIMHAIAKHEKRIAEKASARNLQANIDRCITEAAPIAPVSIKSININNSHNSHSGSLSLNVAN